MARYLFDIETNGLYEEVSTIHCIVARDIDTGETLQANCNDQDKLNELIRTLEAADEIVAHNGIFYDVPVLDKLVGFKPKGQVFDTLVASRLIWPDVSDMDYGRASKGDFPSRLIGSHSLEAYGYRMRVFKGDYGKKENAWAEWTQEMQDYCVQDVEVLGALYEKIKSKNYSDEALYLEHAFATIINKQIISGVLFDADGADKLAHVLKLKQAELMAQMQSAFGTWIEAADNGKVHKTRVTKKDPEAREYIKIRYIDFNPNSRQHIARFFRRKYNWSPDVLTEKGSAKIDESVLSGLDFPEAKLLSEYLMIGKRIGMIEGTANSWLNSIGVDERIHGNVNTCGAVSGRCTHSRPNLAQIPAVRSPYGKECRALFTVPKDKVMVGFDASGLELRVFAHYMHRYDGGRYTNLILEGDIHKANQKAAGLATRDMAKTFIYALLYGAGNAKIGTIVGGSDDAGRQLKERFFAGTPGFERLMRDVKTALKTKKFLKGLDGRELKSRSEHSALNLLFQSAGAVIMKKALCILDKYLDSYGIEVKYLLNIHDEAQLEVSPEDVEDVKTLCVASIRDAGEYFKFKCPLDGEAKHGHNWADTH